MLRREGTTGREGGLSGILQISSYGGVSCRKAKLIQKAEGAKRSAEESPEADVISHEIAPSVCKKG